MRAEDIKNNPDLWAKCQEKLGKKHKAIKSLTQLRKVAAKKMAEKEPGEGSPDEEKQDGNERD
jgi:hypothetical protein